MILLLFTISKSIDKNNLLFKYFLSRKISLVLFLTSEKNWLEYLEINSWMQLKEKVYG